MTKVFFLIWDAHYIKYYMYLCAEFGFLISHNLIICIMKHIISIIFSYFVFVTLSAQTVQDRLGEIREAYDHALHQMQLAQEEPNIDNSMHITMRRMFGGSGMQTYTVDYYCGDFSGIETADGVSVWSPYFIRVKFNWAARVTEKEYLLEPKTGALMFVYTRSDDNLLEATDDDGLYEIRKYYYPDGTYCTGSAKVTLPDGSVKSLDSELSRQISGFDSDVDEIKFVNHLVTVHNQMMNYEQ